jgi:rfaE bifunctional protein kinase chain/domain
MNPKKADKLLLKFQEGRILVVGDVILDEFLYGVAERISPEAPVPVVEIRRETTQLGGAANVVNNLRALGAKAALCGVVGNDEGGNRILRLLHDLQVPADGVAVQVGRPTSVKTRVIASNQQVVRFDREMKEELDAAPRSKLIRFIQRAIKNFNAIIVSDYGKGVISRPLMDAILTGAKERGIPVLVDPKPENIALFVGATAITPNLKEAGMILQRRLTTNPEIEAGGAELLERMQSAMVLITRGEQGISLYQKGADSHHIPTRARQVYDVTGAGDTVVAVLALALTAGASPVEAAELANHAAGIVVGKLGTATATADEIREALTQGRNASAQDRTGSERKV